MDRALDEVIGERQSQRGGDRGRRDRRRDNWPRDGPRKVRGSTSPPHPPIIHDRNIALSHMSSDRKHDFPGLDTHLEKDSARDPPRDLNSDWVHDKFEDDDDNNRPSARGRRSRRPDRYSPEREVDTQSGAKIRIENLHWDLTEDDLEGLFSRIGPVRSVKILYDRAGRSEGVAFVVYESSSDARVAIDEFSGANANGQPIYLKLVPNTSRPAAAAAARNPFDNVQKPARSLFDRVSSPSATGGRRRRDDRSASPSRPRRSDVTKPAPSNIDRYVPGQRRSSRSPVRRRGGRGRGGRGRGEGERAEGVRRPRKTQEELDAEMDDYWGGKEEAGGATAGGAIAPEATSAQNGGGVAAADATAPPAAAAGAADGDIDMIE
ncbi:RNA-binding domain-containing protein [Xylona heveae TC161]|uniref:RNA-binding domain-containing protein n=1 Tax=Xylona heveae (strain CBS 132557 / TC161) TaxID=1328760 RepID=A0A161TBM0_XYLHT|nr:RNA-binding domain-containing protein [Xylona heveae TC161]KZF23067.1 RNA-binding domain-containing protein [Xylona heveae TC161]